MNAPALCEDETRHDNVGPHHFTRGLLGAGESQLRGYSRKPGADYWASTDLATVATANTGHLKYGWGEIASWGRTKNILSIVHDEERRTVKPLMVATAYKSQFISWKVG